MKTKEEEQFDALLAEYFEKFGENYPLDITSMLSTSEHVSRIKQAIKADKPVKEERNNPNVDY